MRVERIELIGFKSFGDKISLELHPGITGIVGPNGCGKSNVVDAFKWVLGEQSVKSLRGGKMEEVIYAGSSTKKPRGMCEVSLHISGLAGAEATIGKENVTTVTRRLYRSGESEYFLNRRPCRLKDIRDVFLDTGLEVKSYSILEQDRVSSILTAKPEDRRFLIEEVAGVVKYKVRRHEAQNKLDSSRQNLARISDITAEIKRQLNSLDRQAKKAERYKKLMEELREVELRLARTEFTALSASLEETSARHEAAREEEAGVRAEIGRIEADIETRRLGLAEDEQALAALMAELSRHERSLAEHSKAIAVARTDQEHLKENIVRLKAQIEDTAARREASLKRKDELISLGEGIDREIAELSATMDTKGAEVKSAEDQIKDREHHLDTRRRDSFRVSDELGAVRSELNRQRDAHEGLGKKLEEVIRESESLTNRLAEFDALKRELEAAMLQKNNEVLFIRENRERLTGEINAARVRLETLRINIGEAREALASASSRLDSLREMDFVETTAEELKEGVKIVAEVSESIEAPKEYERAIEAALGETAGGFVLENYDDIKSAVRVLDQKGMGRTAFVPSDPQGQARTGRQLPERARAWAVNLVRVRGGSPEVAHALLADTLVVNDLDAALAVRQAGARDVTIVTLQGEIVQPSGAVVAGKSRGLLALKRQMRELTEEIARRKSAADQMQAEHDTLRQTLTEKEKESERMQARTNEIEKDLSILRIRAERNTEEVERANRKQAHMKMEHDQITREQGAIQAAIEAKAAEASRIESQKGAVEESINALMAEINAARQAFEQKRAESVEMKLRVNSCRERRNSIASEAESIERLLREFDEKDQLLAREIEATGKKIETLAADAARKEQESATVAALAQEVSAKIAALKDALTGRSEEVRGYERDMKSLHSRLDEAVQKLSELDVRRVEHRMRIENIETIIRTNYAVEIRLHEAPPAADEDPALVDELKRKIESLGPVSLGSIEEYEEIRSRFEFHAGQQEDLQKSIAELEEAISRINATTRKKLREAYEALRTKFAEVFVQIFGGGRAELALTDENNILDTGLDIVAQPPGKRFQNITLLSGGEKTLTALALLFAGFLIKPTPICILDEADAALDESNTFKFAELLKSMSADIQFVVVTHNRVTMESADYIYGVTMEEPGNSKVVSLELASS